VSKPGYSQTTTKRILLVDDSELLRLGTAAMLELLGYDVDLAGGGLEALDLIRSHRSYAAVIMDIHMPDMNGFECATEIRELEHSDGMHTPIIGMSSSCEHNIRETCLNAGMDAFLDKGCRDEELMEALSRYIRD
jgi:CheY-like chemotaxis protein